MKIKKIGHCCLVISVGGLRIMTDPGNYSTGQEHEKDIDAVLITHEHADHFHIESLKKILESNPHARVITNQSVSKLLEQAGISHEIISNGQAADIGGVAVEGYGEKHADIYKTIAPVENTGYFIGSELFYPGDAFTNPGKPVRVLALPVAGPWMKISEAIEYALEIRPRIAFPVHDAQIVPDKRAPIRRIPIQPLEEAGIKLVALEEGEEADFQA